eukprot:CAMPEP_0202969588 /NCGR_PEP_ID=MMETSP1396-20130829/15393_1 /ASSEMBLY_ACC=CAM_ASM_000872 /TAXON_ID= /ORGANISM="Pseudokeronopsis sp., Strain Brazil" /LENGTH=42 /DNA_ID= /DNA_START= /DNA_END= /DNA_ORIENTATION=
MNEEFERDDDIDKEDHVIQFPWQVEAPPTEDEMKRRTDMRKE